MLTVATIAFNVPWVISEQIRLFEKHLRDEHQLIVFDNSGDMRAAVEIQAICFGTGTKYVRVNHIHRLHHHALQVAAHEFRDGTMSHFGFVDHDVFPMRSTSLVPLIDQGGAVGLGQTHPPSGSKYLWPGFFFVSRAWLGARPLNFFGLDGARPEERGDTGSMNHYLFSEEDWERMHRVSFEYRDIREPDGYGKQSSGVEHIGDWLHLSNTSGWMTIPNPSGREQIVRRMVSAL